jgi:hypothetical protein
MLTTAPRDYGVANPAEARLMSGREFLEAIIDGRLPAPPIARTLSFLLTEIGDAFAAFEGDPGEHLLNPLGPADFFDIVLRKSEFVLLLPDRPPHPAGRPEGRENFLIFSALE